MTDQPVTDAQKTPDPGTPNAADNKPAIDEAELEILREKAGRMDVLDGAAVEAGRDRIETYFEDLETFATDKINKETPKPASPDPSGDKPDAKAPDPVAAQPDPQLMEQLKQGQQLTMQALIKTHQVEFDASQRVLPEEERSTVKTAELEKMLRGPESGLVAKIAPKFGGNLFAAANHIHNVEHGNVAARKAGAASEAATNTAANTSGLSTGGATAEPKGPPTPEEAAVAENAKRADEIYKDARPYEHPDLK